jgi:type IX secretion system PorP/SprF family membrane protein
LRVSAFFVSTNLLTAYQMFKKIHILFLLIVSELSAQQLPMFGEYLHNSYTANPSMMGWEGIQGVSAGYRHQWTGMPNSPRTATLGYQEYNPKYNMGYGAYFMHDQTGPTSFTSLNLNYAYHIKLASEKSGDWDRNRLSIGMSLAGTVYRLRGRDLQYNDADDDLIINANQSKFLPDLGIGATYYNDLYFVSASMPQALSMRVKYTADDALSTLRRITHFYISAGAKLEIQPFKRKAKRDFIIPTIYMRFVPMSPLNINLIVRYMWDYKFSGGLGFSTDGSMLLDFNVNLNKKFRIGYAFGVGLNGLARYIGTNHELMLTYVMASSGGWFFEKIDKKPKVPNN